MKGWAILMCLSLFFNYPITRSLTYQIFC